jgi:alpha-glucosidase
MGLNAGLSLLPGYGHDVGGFFGPRPSPSLFVRWVQSGIFHPRFCIHSWKSEGITEPWMYPEVLDIIRDAIHFRYRLIPYLYQLSIESNRTGIPVIRPLIFEFQKDEECAFISFDYMLGPSLLISSIVTENEEFHQVYLPKNEMWCDIWTGKW